MPITWPYSVDIIGELADECVFVAAGVAGVDGGVGLEHVHYRSIAHGDGAVLGGDIAPGEGKGQLAQGVADGVHVLAHVELIGIAQGDRLEVAHVDFQHSDVVLLFTAHQGGVIALAVGEKHLDVADAVDDVIIGEDVAGAAVAAAGISRRNST